MGGFAPSSQFTAYTVISQATSLSKTVEQASILEAQRKNFYRTALIEIVTLLNGAVDRSYLTYVRAYHTNIPGENNLIDGSTIIAENDPIMPDADYMAAINLMQKRVCDIKVWNEETHQNDIVDTRIYDPLKGKQIDRIISVEQQAIGFGKYENIQQFSGQIKSVKLQEMQSILKFDFAHGAYKDDIVYLEIGGDPVPPSFSSTGTSWLSADPDCPYLPKTGSYETLFNSYWIRLRKDRNNDKIYLKPIYEAPGDGEEDPSGINLEYIIWFNRLPNFPVEGTTNATDGWRPDSTHPSRFIDLPDKYMPLLVKRIYTYCLLQLNQQIPDQLSRDILNDYQQIYAMMDADTRSTYQPKLEQITSQLGR